MQLTFWNEQPLDEDADQEDREGVPSRSIGKAGEYIVAAELELAGYACSFAAEGLPYDLIAQAQDGQLCRIQVKTKTAPKESMLPKGGRWSGYVFKSPPAFCDYEGVDAFAFVALDKRVATYVRANLIRTRNISIPEKRFADLNVRALSLTQAISVVEGDAGEGVGTP